MIPSAPFIRRPVATTLLTLAIVLIGIVAFRLLPVAPLPQVDFPTIVVRAQLPGASPETMAATVATPLERALGRIAGVNEMTSNNSLGSTNVVLQFDLSRNIDGAARDVQAAINAARGTLPTMPSNPTYRKANPADAPIMILGLTSDTLTRGQMYDAADSILAQKLMQIKGVGDVTVGGGAQPAVRVDVNPQQLNHYGLTLEQLRTTISGTNANRPKGVLDDGDRQWQVQANDQANRAADYMPLIVQYSNGAAIRLSGVAQVKDSVLDVRNAGLINGQPSVMLIIFRQPGANIIDTIDRIKAALPQLKQEIPAAINTQIVVDRSPTIRASLKDVETAFVISVALVILVVFLFLRNGRATAIPAISVPVSLIGTFAVMYLCGYSLNNISLMALTIATGFVVDDTIVVLENIARHLEEGASPMQAALKGAQEVGFTVLSMSISLIAVFTPILLMGGIIGRLFHEFAVSLSAAIVVSMLVALTTTPMLCARWLKAENAVPSESPKQVWWPLRASERGLIALQNGYRTSLQWALRHSRLMLLILLATIGLNVYLYIAIPKGFFPQQDIGILAGNIRADQSISFQAMEQKLKTMMDGVTKDPAVDKVAGFTGGSNRNSANLFVMLKPLAERKESADAVIARLRKKLNGVPGAQLFLQAQQDIRFGGRSARAQYQYTLSSDNLADLKTWTPKVQQALEKIPLLKDLNSDQDAAALNSYLQFDRNRMAQLGITQAQIDAILGDAFSQKPISTIYNPLNQYRVVLGVAPEYWQNPDALNQIYLKSGQGGMVPLSAIATWNPSTAPLGVSHQGGFAAATLSFNLDPGVSLSQATEQINQAVAQVGLPANIQPKFAGTANMFQSSLSSLPVLILAALIAVYIVLGMLYESWIHPLTILSTLPSAGVGALIALWGFGSQFDVIALIGILLLIGIVKKNAIMMVDFALAAERERGLEPHQAIFEACVMRFRPIMMTTLAALFGALPLALGRGDGAELRQPLGIAIVGGLFLSQLLTLYTTPVVYLYLDRWRVHYAQRKQARQARTASAH